MTIRDRIKEFRRVLAKTLLPNPRNWRTHPSAQRDALKGILAEVGYADALLARETPAGLMLVDGHLRAETTPDEMVPVLVLDLTDAEADKMLATLDPLAAMAGSADAALADLLAGVTTEDPAVRAMLDSIGKDSGIFDVGEVSPPTMLDGDRSPFRQMTFTVHDSQFEQVEEAIKKAKAKGGGNSDVNENSNGNALAFICGEFSRG